MKTINLASGQSSMSESSVNVEALAMEATEPARALSSPRVGTQAYFWTAEWQQKERLADYDFLIGDTFTPSDVEDLIASLHEVADAAPGQDS